MKAHILLVEYDFSVRASLKRMLESEDYEVAIARDGAQGRLALLQQPIDLVLMDVDMPFEDGWTDARSLAAHSHFRPVLIITARPGQHQQAADVGADVLMEKPLNLPVLLEVLHRLLERSADYRQDRFLSQFQQTAA